MQYRPSKPVFDYGALRLGMGLIALSLPFIVTLIAGAVGIRAELRGARCEQGSG